MLSLELVSESKKNWFQSGRSTFLEATLLVPDAKNNNTRIPISPFVQSLFTNVSVLREVFKNGIEEDSSGKFFIKDLRGRPRESFSKRGGLVDGQEEFFRSDGVVLNVPRRIEDYRNRKIEELDAVPFSYGLQTQFEQYRGSSSVHHEVLPKAEGPLEPYLNFLRPTNITNLIPLRLDRIRIGCEFYRRSFFGGTLGFAPNISERLYLEVLPKKIFIRVSGEERGRGRPGGFMHGIIRGIDSSLKRTGLFEDFEKQTKQTIEGPYV